MDDGPNPYQVLGVENGPDASAEEIKKAYRRLALIKHPDKAKTPNAAAEFMELQKAYAVLTDKDARGALDDYLRAKAAREERYAQQNAKRQKMRDELDKREKQFATEKSEESQAKARLQAELANLRRKMEAEQQQRRAHAHAAAAAARSSGSGSSAAGDRAAPPASAAAAAAATAAPAGGDEEATELLRRTLKVSWDPAVSTYTSEQLRLVFAGFGAVEDVVLKDRTKRRTAVALVVMATLAAAEAAAGAVCGSVADPLLVVPYLRVAPGGGGDPDGAATAAAAHPSRQHPPSAAAAAAAAAAALPQPRPAAPLFPAFASAHPSLPAMPAKPLFPGAAPAAAAAAAGGTSGLGSFSSFAGSSSSSGAGSGRWGAAAGCGAPATSYESSVLDKMRVREAERAKLIAQIQQEEGNG